MQDLRQSLVTSLDVQTITSERSPDLGIMRRLHDISRFHSKDGGSLECFDTDQRTVNER